MVVATANLGDPDAMAAIGNRFDERDLPDRSHLSPLITFTGRFRRVLSTVKGTPVLGEQTAVALFAKGVMLSELGRNEEAVAAYEEVVSRFGDDPAPALREQVARARSPRASR